MTEDQETTEDKLSRLKLKLKNMGVMRDENTYPEHKSKPFWRGKLPILLVIFFTIGFIGWISRNDLTLSDPSAHTKSVSDTDSARVQRSLYPSYENFQANPVYPPPSTIWNRAPLYNSVHRAMGPAEFRYEKRYYDRYGPPPGWRPHRVYPPPPVYYGQFYYYGPPPEFYRNSGYRGYNGQFWSAK